MRSWVYLLLASGCGFSVAGSPDGSVTGDGIDALPRGEAGPDASFCYGSGFGKVCLSTAPSAPLALGDGVLDTDGDACTQVTSGVCVVAATELTIAPGITVRALGSRPLVLVGTSTVTMDGTIGASSLRTQPAGAGSSTSPCAVALPADADTGGGAGGAGGSFGGTGGSGGTGDTNNSGLPEGARPGQGAASPSAPVVVRGGCSGGAGGTGVGPGGVGGRGGGAIYMIAGTSITVTGRVYAVGEGGRFGNNLGGGGGAGSGGLLGFDAPTVTISGAVIANGGGGGEGAGIGAGTNGVAGGDGTSNGARAPGGVSGTAGGNGGDSSGGGSSDAIGGQGVFEGGGGGGGGAGYIYVKGTMTPAVNTISPAPTLAP